MTLPRRLAAETLGSALLAASVIGSGIMAETLSGGNAGLALLANTIATGAMLYVLITALGPVSGAHFNPAVTLAFAVRREIGAGEAALYAAVQAAGMIAGAVVVHAMFSQDLIQVSGKARDGAGQFIAEAVATMGLIFTIMGTRRIAGAVAPSVALYIVAAYWFTASTSFANPAITLARALSDTFAGIAPHSAGPFVAVQIAAALAATPLCAWLFAERRAG